MQVIAIQKAAVIRKKCLQYVLRKIETALVINSIRVAVWKFAGAKSTRFLLRVGVPRNCTELT